MGATAITQGITSVLNLGLGLLAQHTARVQGASNENEACAQLAPAIQQDLQEIADAVTSGQLSAKDAITAVQQVDAQTQGYIQKQQGQAGVSFKPQFNGPITFVTTQPAGVNLGQGTACNKTCTVGCCIYYNSWKPAFVAMEYFLQNMKAGNPFSVSIAAMQSNKYGFPGFPAYTISCTIASMNSVTSVESAVTSAEDFLTGNSASQPSQQDASPVSTSRKISPIVYIGGIVLAVLAIFSVKRN